MEDVAQNRGIPCRKFKITHRFTIGFKIIVKSKSFTSWLLSMAEHPPTPMKIASDRQDGDSELASGTESHKSTVVTAHKKVNTVLLSRNTNIL